MARPILARATIHLPGGLIPGEVYWVNHDAEYVQEALACGALVVEEFPEGDPDPEVEAIVAEQEEPDVTA